MKACELTDVFNAVDARREKILPVTALDPFVVVPSSP